MTTQQSTSLEEAIREAGDGWLIDRFVPPTEAMDHIRRQLDEVDRCARERLGGNAPHLTESSLLAEYKRNPLKVKGCFQALGGSRSPGMLLMAWRIIQGMEVTEISIAYRRQEAFEASVVLESPCGDRDQPYVSSDIQDFALFRHIGILEIGGRPVFGGFYPLSLLG